MVQNSLFFLSLFLSPSLLAFSPHSPVHLLTFLWCWWVFFSLSFLKSSGALITSHMSRGADPAFDFSSAGAPQITHCLGAQKPMCFSQRNVRGRGWERRGVGRGALTWQRWQGVGWGYVTAQGVTAGLCNFWVQAEACLAIGFLCRCSSSRGASCDQRGNRATKQNANNQRVSA